MRVKDVMSSGVVTCDPESSLQEVAKRMKQHDVGFVPIVRDEKVTALITDRDLVTRALADEMDAGSQVGDVVTPRIWTIHENENIETMADLMKAKRVRRLVVLDGEERPVGVVSLGDLAHHGDPVVAGAVLESISAPAKPQRVDERDEALPAFARSVDE